MRDSNRTPPSASGRRLIAIIVVATVVAACGGAGPSATPKAVVAATPAPTATPDPHLVAPASLEVIYEELQAAGLEIVANNAGSGETGEEPRRTLVATLAGWPLIINEYSSAKALTTAKRWKKGAQPGYGEPPVAIRGMNILVEYGPTTGRKPSKPEGPQQAAVTSLVSALDPLLHPLRARANVEVRIPRHAAPVEPSLVPSASPS